MSDDRSDSRKRPPLSRDRVVDAAVALADAKGASGASMRAVASTLGVEAMSLYNHVRGRGDLLDGMVNAVFAEIDLPAAHSEWRPGMRARAISARAALRRHPWAVGLMDAPRRPGPAMLRHHDALLGALRAGGFALEAAAHALSVIDSYVYGFALQELSLPFADEDGAARAVSDLGASLPSDQYPHLAALVAHREERGGPDSDAEFLFGLDLILASLDPVRATV